jgi:hypothetical protein
MERGEEEQLYADMARWRWIGGKRAQVGRGRGGVGSRGGAGGDDARSGRHRGWGGG